MAFGDDGCPSIKICCGPRCGAFPGHRTLYRALESGSATPVRPILCQGLCGNGVTVVQATGEPDKVMSLMDVRKWLQLHSRIEDSNNNGNR